MFDYYYGKEDFEKNGKLVYAVLLGRAISKRIDDSPYCGGLEYEANLLGMDKFELLRTLEGLCYNEMAEEVNDHTYVVGTREDRDLLDAQMIRRVLARI